MTSSSTDGDPIGKKLLPSLNGQNNNDDDDYDDEGEDRIEGVMFSVHSYLLLQLLNIARLFGT